MARSFGAEGLAADMSTLLDARSLMLYLVSKFDAMGSKHGKKMVQVRTKKSFLL